jgi:hypothetical protein
MGSVAETAWTSLIGAGYPMIKPRPTLGAALQPPIEQEMGRLFWHSPKPCVRAILAPERNPHKFRFSASRFSRFCEGLG